MKPSTLQLLFTDFVHLFWQMLLLSS